MPSLPPGTPSVVLDANTVVSALLKPGSVPARAVALAFARCEVCVSDAMQAELVGVLARPKLRRFLDEGAVLGFLSLMRGRARRVVPRERVADCRDAKDNMVLEAALAGGRGGDRVGRCRSVGVASVAGGGGAVGGGVFGGG